MTTLEQSLSKLMSEIPLLNDFGIGIFDGHLKKTLEERQKIFDSNRKNLAASLEPIQRTIDWLTANVASIKTINRKHTSYGLKHIAEHDIKYITNGVFIAAAILAGYPYLIVAETPNVQFGMSERSLNEVRTRQQAR